MTGSQHPFVTINCAAIPDSLVESELFGHAKGSFSGATSDKIGLLEAADRGTLFLDEIGDLSPAAQSKLLRAIETKRILRLGEVRERLIDIRMVVATNRDLSAEVAAGRFRQDLHFRLGVATLVLPPLRQRPREVPILARTFLADACARGGRGPMTLSRNALERLTAHVWIGNVRELKQVMEYAAAAAEGNRVELEHLPERNRDVASVPRSGRLADELRALGPTRRRAARTRTRPHRASDRSHWRLSKPGRRDARDPAPHFLQEGQGVRPELAPLQPRGLAQPLEIARATNCHITVGRTILRGGMRTCDVLVDGFSRVTLSCDPARI